jgi:hypothetical protein
LPRLTDTRFPTRTGEPVELRYALTERIEHYHVGPPGHDDHARGHWRGETLMVMEPAGRFHPIYNRPPRVEPAVPSEPHRAPIESL